MSFTVKIRILRCGLRDFQRRSWYVEDVYVRQNLQDAVGDEFSIVTSIWDTRIDRSAAWWPWPLSLSWLSPGRRPFSALLPALQLPKDWLGIISAGLLYVFCTRNQRTLCCRRHVSLQACKHLSSTIHILSQVYYYYLAKFVRFCRENVIHYKTEATYRAQGLLKWFRLHHFAPKFKETEKQPIVYLYPRVSPLHARVSPTFSIGPPQNRSYVGSLNFVAFCTS